MTNVKEEFDGKKRKVRNVSLLRMWLKGSKRNEVSASEDEVDSEYEDDVDDAEGPTLVTVDDGKGGVKHVKVKFKPSRSIKLPSLNTL